jgi:hypothetical protein
MRRTLLALVVASVFLSVASCGRPPRPRAENEILFTITQTATSTDARWQFLTLAHDGQVQQLWDDECYYEPLDERVGELRVEDGVATWKTPLLPDDGLVLHANEAHAHLDRPAWSTGDVLAFDARGFAMPEPKPLTFDAPPAELEVLAPLAGDLDLERGGGVDVLWRPPPQATFARVVVQLDAESEDRILCFFDATTGHGAIDPGLVDVLRGRSPSKAATLKISTHRQVTVAGPDRWLIYVVANHVARTQPVRLN